MSSGFRRDMLFSAGVTGASAAFNFLMQLLVMRLFGVAAYGAFSFWRNNVWLAGSIGRFGLQGLAFREVSVMQLTGSRAHLNSFLRMAVLVVLILGTVAAAALLLADAASREPKGDAWLFWLSSLLFAASITANAVYRVLGSLRLSLVFDRLIQNPVFIALVALMWWHGIDDARALYAALAISLAVITLLNIVGAWRSAARSTFPADAAMPPPLWGPWLKSGWHLFLLAIGSIIGQRSTLLLAGLYLSSTDLGRFAFMATIAGLIALPLTALNQVTAPALARHKAAGEWSGVRHKIALTRNLGGLIGLVFAVGLLATYPIVERLVGQPGLVDLTVFAILMVATVLNAAFGPVAIGLSMIGEERFAATVLNGAVALKVIALLVVGPRYGMVGFALVEVGFMLLWNGLMAFKLGQVLKIR